MKLSAFNLYVDDYPAPGQTLVHNTFSGAFVILPRTALQALATSGNDSERRDSPQDHPDQIVGVADLMDPNVGVVVDSLEEEEREYLAWFDWRRSRRTLQSIVGINLACNFDCPYCCQADFMDGAVMKPEIVDRTADWLAGRASQIDADSAHVVFVGGEPLLHPDRIKAIAARLRSRIEREGIELTIGLITNGYFLSDEMVRELLPFGLTVAQVTVDGDHTTHHRTRVSKKGEDTFARIFANVVAASRRIRVTINGNYQEDTVSGFAPLVEKLAAAGLPASTKINFTPALEVLGAAEGTGSGSCTWSGSAYRHRVALHDQIVRHGFHTAGLQIVGPCAFHDRHMYAIDHLGNIYQCPGFLGHPEWRIGCVESGLTGRYQAMLEVGVDRRCAGCAHQPNCAGGCLAHEFIQTGQTGGVNCEVDYFDAVKRDALVRGYLLATSDDRGRAVAEFPSPPTASDGASSDLPGGRGERVRPPRGVRTPALRVL
ncbi:MAG: radical SAM protein [Proteobacteria bacterium]|nr:radical SAM protein [Pseudomonadota bacterium]